MPQMRVDMHCDALTSGGRFNGQVKLNELRAAGAMQCFAVFTRDNDAAAYAAAVNLFYATFTPQKGFAAVKRFADLKSAQSSGLTPCALTCENIGFTGGQAKNLARLKSDGVIMASLVWNIPNSLALPNVRKDGLRESGGLTRLGAEAVEILDGLGIIVDISHLSDGGAEQILKGRKIPAAASHSNCDGVCKNPRNLTDHQLKLLAGCGGIAGINFYKKFLGGDGGYKSVAAHLAHIINTAGEDVPALGSDWDGVERGGISICPRDMPKLFAYLHDSGFTPRVLEKFAYKNFLRVFCGVLG